MDYRKYADYELIDFLEDDKFVKWVNQPDEAGNLFWLEVQKEYPEKTDLIEKSIVFVRAYRSQDNFSNNEASQFTWDRIEKSIQSKEALQPTRKVFRLPVFFRAAAAVLIVTVAALWIIKSNQSEPGKTMSFTTGFGEIKNIILPDQSVVTLNSNSSLTYNSEQLPNTAREVWIQGEAYFNVTHINKDSTNIKPTDRFIVRCDDINIEVLGTTFNVKARHGKTDVALITGKIRINYNDETKNSKTMLMAPGDYVQYAEKKVLVAKKLSKPEQLISWTAELISFTDATLNDIAETLTERFGYKVSLKDPALAEMKIEGEISVNSVAELLDVVITTLNLKIEQSANKNISISK